MHNGNYKSIKALMSRLLANPLMNGANESDIAQYTADALKLIAAPMAYVDKVEHIDICDYRGELPCDILYIIQTQKQSNAVPNRQPTSRNNHFSGYTQMTYASDHFHTALHSEDSPDLRGAMGLDHGDTYSIQVNQIYTSFKDGKVRMAYKAILTDEDGFPMIPDKVEVEKAVENHVKLEVYTPLWEQGKITDKVFQRVSQERDWYIGSANTSLQIQNIDQAERMKAAFTRTLLNPLSQHTGFKNFGTQEYINKGSI